MFCRFCGARQSKVIEKKWTEFRTVKLDLIAFNLVFSYGNNEKDGLMLCLLSKRPEFVVVYGRRRVGKTYLIREFFNRSFSFYATGLKLFQG